VKWCGFWVLNVWCCRSSVFLVLCQGFFCWKWTPISWNGINFFSPRWYIKFKNESHFLEMSLKVFRTIFSSFHLWFQNFLPNSQERKVHNDKMATWPDGESLLFGSCVYRILQPCQIDLNGCNIMLAASIRLMLVHGPILWYRLVIWELFSFPSEQTRTLGRN